MRYGDDDTSPAALPVSLNVGKAEFADASRDETRWKKVMGVVQEKGGSVTVPGIGIRLLLDRRRDTKNLR